jgi:hypothetical protein
MNSLRDLDMRVISAAHYSDPEDAGSAAGYGTMDPVSRPEQVPADTAPRAAFRRPCSGFARPL